MTKEDVERIKDTVIIYYIWWAMQPQDRWMWCAELNGEVIDYHKKDVLKKNAEEKGLPWIVVRHHKKNPGKISIIERSEKQ